MIMKWIKVTRRDKKEQVGLDNTWVNVESIAYMSKTKSKIQQGGSYIETPGTIIQFQSEDNAILVDEDFDEIKRRIIAA